MQSNGGQSRGCSARDYRPNTRGQGRSPDRAADRSPPRGLPLAKRAPSPYPTFIPEPGFRIRRPAYAVGLPIALAIFSCSRPDPVLLVSPSAVPSAGAVTDHVIVVSIDGLRPDAIDEADAQTLQRLIREGTAAGDAETILPSTTLPSHTSMLTGLEPSEHGVTWNSNEVDPWGTVAVPTVFEIAHAHGFRTAAFFGKSKFHYLQRKGSLDYSEAPGRLANNWRLARTVVDVEGYLAQNHPNLLFIHLGEPDYAGHSVGWMSPLYVRAVADADVGLARILAAADRSFGVGAYTLIVTADHGGHDRVHGSSDPRDVTIPWIAWGRGVRPGGTLVDLVRTMDTAATILWLLGIPIPPIWAGVAQVNAFTVEARAKAVAASTSQSH
jgi:arylsulfatase A-like enzyme